jgi:class 3 adenylate cyclase
MPTLAFTVRMTLREPMIYSTHAVGSTALATERVERRLAAILAADIAAYSRLMGVDEEGTLARLKALRRELADPKIKEHRGRIVKTTGDGLLIEFASVVDAVRCAVEVQREMAERNADVPPDGRIEFRMGINPGDIIKDRRDIYGDGVNVAARLEALAEPGGICVSRVVGDQVRESWPFRSRIWASSRSRTSRGRYACTVSCSAKEPDLPSRLPAVRQIRRSHCRTSLRLLFCHSRT